MRHTRATTGDGRSHHALTGPRLSKCQKCGEMHQRHRACANCGTYRNKEVIDVLAKIGKQEKKAKAKSESK